ncbi:6661_t:CDS:2, partial [Scutellospora calospora]
WDVLNFHAAWLKNRYPKNKELAIKLYEEQLIWYRTNSYKRERNKAHEMLERHANDLDRVHKYWNECFPGTSDFNNDDIEAGPSNFNAETNINNDDVAARPSDFNDNDVVAGPSDFNAETNINDDDVSARPSDFNDDDVVAGPSEVCNKDVNRPNNVIHKRKFKDDQDLNSIQDLEERIATLESSHVVLIDLLNDIIEEKKLLMDRVSNLERQLVSTLSKDCDR